MSRGPSWRPSPASLPSSHHCDVVCRPVDSLYFHGFPVETRNDNCQGVESCSSDVLLRSIGFVSETTRLKRSAQFFKQGEGQALTTVEPTPVISPRKPSCLPGWSGPSGVRCRYDFVIGSRLGVVVFVWGNLPSK